MSSCWVDVRWLCWGDDCAFKRMECGQFKGNDYIVGDFNVPGYMAAFPPTVSFVWP